MKQLTLAVALALAVFAWQKRDDAEPTRLTFAGATSPGPRITAFVEEGRLVAFRARLDLECFVGGSDAPVTMPWRWWATVPPTGSDGVPTVRGAETTWQMTWLPAMGPEGTIVSRGLVPPSNDRPREGSAATSILTATLAGRTLRGRLSASLVVERPGRASVMCTTPDVRFSLTA